MSCWLFVSGVHLNPIPRAIRFGWVNWQFQWKLNYASLGARTTGFFMSFSDRQPMTDPDARSIATGGRGTGIMGYTCRRGWTLSTI
jgi:hypothetical protein